MKRACVVFVLLLAAHVGRSQTNFMERQLRMWIDFGSVPNASSPEHQQFFASSVSESSFPSDQSVSVARLRHKVPDKAVSAFLHGVKLAGAGDSRRAAKDFERAVAIDPEYSEAHGNLGVMYIDLGLLDRSAAEFRFAIQLDPAASSHHANLALALIMLDLHKEAEPEAQTAVDLDPSNAKARYLLGFLLARRPETRGRATEQLTYAAYQLPDAHLLLAEMYRLEGADALAQVERERYQKAIQASAKTPESAWR
jgi:tetratricopeptide (TPR) repeat protein